MDSKYRRFFAPLSSSSRTLVNQQATARVQRIDIEHVRERPPLPFDLGTLQEICSAKVGLGAQETLATAQAL